MTPCSKHTFTPCSRQSRLVKRCGEAGKDEKLVKDLQALCPACPVDQIWLLVASFEVFSDSVLDVTSLCIALC